MATIGSSLEEIFQEAAELGERPLAAARRRVHRVLERARTAAMSPGGDAV